MEQCFDNVKIRSLKKSDIDDIIRWNTTDTEWWALVRPWYAKEPIDEKAFREYLLDLAGNEPIIDFQPEIECNGVHIGRCRAHFIDESGKFSVLEDVRHKHIYIAFEVFICELDYMSEDVCAKAVAAYAEYLASKAYGEVFEQTWSGNGVMTNACKKVGFAEHCVTEKKSETSDERFEIVTYKLDMEKFARFKEEYR